MRRGGLGLRFTNSRQQKGGRRLYLRPERAYACQVRRAALPLSSLTLELPTLTEGEVGPRLVPAAAADLYADRYRLGSRIAGGGSGEVWTATDTRTGEPVALKRIPTLTPAEIAAVRREVAALRWLRLPGVVQLRDEGESGTDYFVVMDLVEGAPFLGCDGGPVAWEAVREPVFDLVEILGGVHLSGVLHLDLKPANVYLGPDRRPIILDFGLASGVAIASGRPRPRGATIRYAAPEQLAAQACDRRTDLFALGVMLYEALAGVPPHGLGGWDQVAARRVRGEAKPLLDVAPSVPPEVARAVDALLAPRPEDRPDSAQELTRLLGGRGLLEPPGLPPGDVGSAESLRALFSGTDRFLHLREDAAAILFERTGGERVRVAEELGTWLRTGLARRDGERILVERAAIERLRGGLGLGPRDAGAGGAGPERALRRLVASRAPGAEIVRAARVAADALGEDGRLAAAAGALDLGLAVARQENDGDAERALLEQKAEVALAMEGVPALDRLLPELTRAVDAGVPVEPVRALVQAALLTLTGQERRALALVEALPPFSNEALDGWRQAKRALAARRISPEEGERALLGMATWLAQGPPDRAARVAGWWGNLRYQQARFEEAAALHLQKAEVSSGAARVSAHTNAAYALLEAGRYREAERIARDARDEALLTRHAVFEARAELLLRNVAWRAGRPLAVGEELVDAAAALGVPWLEGAFALQEAAIAWRDGEWALAERLARRSVEGFLRARADAAALLARALVIATVRTPAPDAVDALVADALQCPVPAVAVQALGLARLRLGVLAPAASHTLAALAGTRPRSAWGARLELLSFDEAMGLAAVPPVPTGAHA